MKSRLVLVIGSINLGLIYSQQDREANSSPQPSAEIKNAWSFTSTSLTPPQHSIELYFFLII